MICSAFRVFSFDTGHIMAKWCLMSPILMERIFKIYNIHSLVKLSLVNIMDRVFNNGMLKHVISNKQPNKKIRVLNGNVI